MRRVATHGRICVASHAVPGPRAHHEEGCSVCARRAGSSPHLYVPVGCAVAAVGDRWPHAALHVVRPDHGNVHFQLIFPTPFFGFFLWQRMRNACMFNICELCDGWNRIRVSEIKRSGKRITPIERQNMICTRVVCDTRHTSDTPWHRQDTSLALSGRTDPQRRLSGCPEGLGPPKRVSTPGIGMG